MRVVRVRRLVSGEVALDCEGPRGQVCVELRARLDEPAEPPPYAATGRFWVSFRHPPGTPAEAHPVRPLVDTALVDAVVRALRQIEPRLPDDEP